MVTQTGGITTVVLSGSYFGSIYAKQISSYGHIGDLYISSGGWVDNNPANNSKNDTFDSNEGWNYVVSYNNLTVYSLNLSGITMTNNQGHWTGYRSGQAYRDGYGSVVSTATAVLNSTSDTLTFTFPDLGNVDVMGYHWTMACGNDVVEGGGHLFPNLLP